MCVGSLWILLSSFIYLFFLSVGAGLDLVLLVLFLLPVPVPEVQQAKFGLLIDDLNATERGNRRHAVVCAKSKH